MATIPAALSLRNIGDGTSIIASDHRNNYSDVQSFVNDLRAILAGGTSGQLLRSDGSSAISWAEGGPGDPVTTLPGSPVDKQQVLLTDSTTAPTYQWLLQYEAGITPGAHKWMFIGGAPMVAEVLTSETTSLAATYQDLATVGPSLTVPRAGVYDIEFSCDVNVGASPAAAAVKLGAAATSLNDGANMIVDAAGDGGVISAMVRRTLAASDVVKIQYQGQVPAANTYARRRLVIRPALLA